MSTHIDIAIVKDGKGYRVTRVPSVSEITLSEAQTLAGARHIAAAIEKVAKSRNWTATVIEVTKTNRFKQNEGSS